jgi:hypothetical protein
MWQLRSACAGRNSEAKYNSSFTASQRGFPELTVCGSLEGSRFDGEACHAFAEAIFVDEGTALTTLRGVNLSDFIDMFGLPSAMKFARDEDILERIDIPLMM